MRHYEYGLQCDVVKLLRDEGCVAFHIANERNGGIADARRMKAAGVVKGAPDLVAWIHHQVWWFELKTPTGKRSIEQECMEDLAKELGVHYKLVRCINDIKELI